MMNPSGCTADEYSTLLHAEASPAHAGLLQDITKNFVRPELGSTDALVMMMDARGMLYELKASA